MMIVFSVAFPLAGLCTIRSGLMSDAWKALTVTREALIKRTSHSSLFSANLSSSFPRTSSVSQSSPLTPSRSRIHSEGQVVLCFWRSLFPVLFIWCIMYKGPDVCFTPSLALLSHFASYLCFSILTRGLIRWDWCWAFKTTWGPVPHFPQWKPGYTYWHYILPNVWSRVDT